MKTLAFVLANLAASFVATAAERTLNLPDTNTLRRLHYTTNSAEATNSILALKPVQTNALPLAPTLVVSKPAAPSIPSIRPEPPQSRKRPAAPSKLRIVPQQPKRN